MVWYRVELEVELEVEDGALDQDATDLDAMARMVAPSRWAESQPTN